MTVAGVHWLAALTLFAGACREDTQSAAHVDQVLPPEGPVVDAAGILPDAQEKALDKRLRDYWAREKTAIVVSTTESLGRRNIEDFAFDQFNSWGIGDERTNQGLLVLIAPNERKLRIEVGCGLESVITNDAAKQIIDDTMVPLFKSGDMARGTTSGVEALIERLEQSNVKPGPTSQKCLEIMKEAA